MKTATVTETKSHLSALLSDIEAGEEVVITRRGRPVARLVAEQPATTFDWGDLHAWVAGSVDLVAWLERRRKKGLTISAWTLTEMASVGGIKQRTGAIDSAIRLQALAHFQRFTSAHLGLVEIDPADFRAAAVFIDRPLNLRAGDSLHLAVARRIGARLVSLDRRMGEAADAVGVASVVPA